MVLADPTQALCQVPLVDTPHHDPFSCRAMVDAFKLVNNFHLRPNTTRMRICVHTLFDAGP